MLPNIVVVIVAHRSDSAEAADAAEVVVRVAFGHERIFQTRFARSTFVLNCYIVKINFNVIQSEPTLWKVCGLSIT